jgi:hypothetical protein
MAMENTVSAIDRPIPFSDSDSLSPSKTSPSNARRNPPSIPELNDPTSRAVTVIDCRSRSSSASKAAVMRLVWPNP